MYLIFYDIEKDSVRQRMAKKLLYFGYTRIQYSVFAGCINPESLNMWAGIKKMVQADSNAKIVSLKIPDENFKNMKIIGTLEDEIEYILGRAESIII